MLAVAGSGTDSTVKALSAVLLVGNGPPTSPSEEMLATEMFREPSVTLTVLETSTPVLGSPFVM